MAGIESAGLTMRRFLALLVLALAGAASAEGPNLTALLPAQEDVAAYRLSTAFLQSISPSAREFSGCDAEPVEGMRENLQALHSPDVRTVGNPSVARVILYRFDTAANASLFVECMARLVRNSGQFTLRPASYGDRGFVAELSPGAAQGASLLFRKGPITVSVDALDNSFESAAAHAIARSIEGKLNATAVGPAKSPGFEVVAGLAGLAAATSLRRRKGAARP